MSLAEHLHQSRRGAKCVIGRILDDLPEKDREALIAALGDMRFKGSEIHRALLAEGYRTSYMTTLRHRRRECFCDNDSYGGD